MENPTEPTAERTKGWRTISPFDLTASENPGAVIFKPLLNERNYDDWACALKIALCSRKKFGFLTVTITKPTTDSPYFEDWEHVNALLVSWIKITIEPSLICNISHKENAKDLWDHIKKRFSITSGPKNQQIKADLANCKQQGISVEEYFGKLTKIWDSVTNYRPLRRCTCGKCVCDLPNLLEKDRDEDQVQQFLYGLDDRMFHTIRSTLTARVPLPTLEEAYNLVKQEEDLNNNNQAREEKPEVTAFSAHTKPRFSTSRDNNSMVCKHCHQSGHLSESCFVVVGYPEWWGDRPRYRNTQNRGRGKGVLPRLAASANAVTVAAASTATANRVLTDHDRDAVYGLTDDQWRSVLNLINACKSNATETLSGPHYKDGDWSG